MSGIGFIGGGLIFVRRDSVRGLTTAAGVWLTAAVGMAAGGGLPVLATASTLAYLVVTTTYPVLARRLPGFGSRAVAAADHLPGRPRRAARGARACHRLPASTSPTSPSTRLSEEEDGDPRAVAVRLEVRGRHSLTELVSDLGELEGVLAVHVADANADPDY